MFIWPWTKVKEHETLINEQCWKIISNFNMQKKDTTKMTLKLIWKIFQLLRNNGSE